jgi:predicted transcriptional regulator of viral defense system
MNNEAQYRTLEELVNEIRAKGRYSFSWEEAKRGMDLSDKALNQSLFRLKSKNRISPVRKGFFAIITPEYSKQGMMSANLFIDDLMQSLGKKYYVGMFSAAALYGAAHQQPMEYYVITEKPALRNIKSQKLIINFYVKQDWPEADVLQKKTDVGYINVSTPEFTALDLLTYGKFGINRVLTILEELVEEMKPSDLTKTARNYPTTSSIQRLGYLIDKKIGNEKLANALKKVIKDRKIHPIPLLKNTQNRGDMDNDWKISINTKLESDL